VGVGDGDGVLMMEDAVRNRRGARGRAGEAATKTTTAAAAAATTTANITRHIGEMSTREIGEEDKDRMTMLQISRYATRKVDMTL